MSPMNTVGYEAGQHRGTLHFLQHLAEMTLAMLVGMFASAAVYLGIIGMNPEEALQAHAVVFTLVQAAGMSSAMIVWMRQRHHGWRPCLEMAAVMIAPAVPLIALRTLDVISGSICGTYCALSFAAMMALMLYRREEYSGPDRAF